MRKIMIVTLAVLLVGAFTVGNLYAGESAPAKSCFGATVAMNATAATDAQAVSASAYCSAAMKANCNMTPEQCAKLCGPDGKLTPEECAKLCGKDGKLTPEECAKLCGKDGKCEFTTFSVKGMTCGGCENSIKTALMNVDGVLKVIDVSHKEGVAEVCYDPTKTSSDDLATVITNKGYAAEVMLAAAITNASSLGSSPGCKPGCKAGAAKGCGKTKGTAKTISASEGPH